MCDNDDDDDNGNEDIDIDDSGRCLVHSSKH